MASHPLFPWRFFILAYAISWLLWLPELLGGLVLTPLAVFGPSFAAFWLTFRGEGWAGLRGLLRRVLDWQISFQWLAVTILLPFVITSLTIGVFQISSGEILEEVWHIPDFLPHPLLIVPYFLFTMIFEGPVGEEFGWRGYALDRLQARWSPFISSLTLGIFWGAWHLPLFFLPNGPHADSIPLLAFLFSTIPISIVMTWIYNGAGKNLLTAVLFHQFVNFSLELNPAVITNPQIFTLQVGFYSLAAVLIMVSFKQLFRTTTP